MAKVQAKKEVKVNKHQEKKEKNLAVQTAILALFEEIKSGFQGNENDLLVTIANEYEVDAEILSVSLYNYLFLLNEEKVKSQKSWSKKEDQALIGMVNLLTPHVTKNSIYEVFGTIVGRNGRVGGSVQQHYSFLTGNSKKRKKKGALEEVAVTVAEESTEEDVSAIVEESVKEIAAGTEEVFEASEETVVESIQQKPVVDMLHMEDGHVEHALPAAKEVPTLVDSLVKTFDLLEEEGQNSEEFVYLLSKAVEMAIDRKKENGETAKKLKIEKRELTQQIEDLQFQLEEAHKCIKVMGKNSEQDKKLINELQGEIWNLKTANGSDQIRQLQKFNQYQLDSKTGMLEKKSV